MLEKISGVIQAITEFIGGFSKLNEVKDHSVLIFFRILLCIIIALLMHNTEKYIGGYHKRFYDESFPSVNYAEGITFNYQDYQSIPTNIFPIIGYMLKNKYEWFPDMREVSKVDSGYARILKEHDCIALGMRAMRTSKGEDLGILTVSWRKGHEDRVPAEREVQEKMTEIASKLEMILDMSEYD